MLRQDQAAELLRRCEALIGRELTQLRGNLKNPELRASAVWELLCIDAFAQVATVAYELPRGTSNPDLHLTDIGESEISLEVAYVYPRHWKNERRARDFLAAVYQTAQSKGIPGYRISYHFSGDSTNPAGPLRALPAQHEIQKVLRSEVLVEFFKAIDFRPTEPCEVVVAPFSVRLTYNPTDAGPYVHGSGAVEEAPTKIEEHALFLALERKARQHDPRVPYIVCVGSDQSPAITQHVHPFGINERDAVAEIFRKYGRLTAVIAVAIEEKLTGTNWYEKVARPRLYLNPRATNPLSKTQIDSLSLLDFNRWKFYFPLEKWESPNMESFERSGGSLATSFHADHVSVTIPETILVNCLAGRTSLVEQYFSENREQLPRWIAERWTIVACSFSPGAIEEGLSATVTLTLAKPPENVYFSP